MRKRLMQVPASPKRRRQRGCNGARSRFEASGEDEATSAGPNAQNAIGGLRGCEPERGVGEGGEEFWLTENGLLRAKPDCRGRFRIIYSGV